MQAGQRRRWLTGRGRYGLAKERATATSPAAYSTSLIRSEGPGSSQGGSVITE